MKIRVNQTLLIIGVIISLIVATILGIYGQDISYFVHEREPRIELTRALTIVTFLSIGLYILQPIILIKYLNVKSEYLITYIMICIAIGLLVSSISFFVWAMWIG